MDSCVIMAVCLDKRSKEAARVQEIFTKHGCIIFVRLGLHESVGASCSEEGLILLQLKGAMDEVKELQADLEELPGVRVKSMEI